MTTPYERGAASAHKYITKYGLKYTITRNGAAVGSTYAVSASKKSDATTNGLTMIAETKYELVLSPKGAEPKVGDTLTTTGASVQVIGVEVIKPASTVLYYKVTGT